MNYTAPPTSASRLRAIATAKYIAQNPETVAASAALIEKYPDRLLFGSDVAAPKSIDAPLAVCNAYDPLWKVLKPETMQRVAFGNYERLFDEARSKVRAWEKANVSAPTVGVSRQ